MHPFKILIADTSQQLCDVIYYISNKWQVRSTWTMHSIRSNSKSKHDNISSRQKTEKLFYHARAIIH